MSKTATKQLQAVKVSIKLSTKIRGSAKTPDGKEELTLSDGSKMTTDLYIPTMGLVPNSTYIPSNLLNASGFVNVDEYLKVKGVKDVWAVGDVSAVERPQYVNTEKQSVHVAKNITLLLSNKQPVIYKVDPKRKYFPNLFSATNSDKFYRDDGCPRGQENRHWPHGKHETPQLHGRHGQGQGSLHGQNGSGCQRGSLLNSALCHWSFIGGFPWRLRNCGSVYLLISGRYRFVI